MSLRPLGQTQLRVTPLGMGCWPITGISSIDVNEADSLATIQAAFESGINFFDTAYCYGFEGESERMIARVLEPHRDEIVLASKGGLHWVNRQQARCGRPDTLRRECEESLRRLHTDRIELYYLHVPDPHVPLAESAGAIGELIRQGKVLSAGLSNATAEQLREFHRVCPLTAYQPHFNMLQREIEDSQLPWCVEHGVSVVVYWPLMKGLLAGHLPRDHVFDPKDGRRKYPMFSGDEWQKNQDFLDVLRTMSADLGRPVSQIVLNWTIQRAGITAALCGAKRPHQIQQNAEAMNWSLTADQIARINAAIAARGTIISQAAVS
ncbi:MAG TPA: aldo/keto reductase [Planctomycetaceae bacterium]|nr:aldo/keto reductase [Planctomycetaceae bacterium]